MTIADVKLPISDDTLRSTLRNYGVVEAKLFGSYARGEQNIESDIDLFIQLKPGVGLFDVFDFQTELERQAGTKVDLVD